jgi:nicotinamide N-methyltransferase
LPQDDLPMPPRIGPAERAFFDEQGYIIVRQAFTPARIAELREAVARVLEKAAAGVAKDVYWSDGAERRVPARVAHLLSPDKYEDAFGRWLDEDLSPQIETLLDGPARHSLFGLIGGGAGKKYLLPWHRDLGKPGAPDEVAHMARYHRRFVQFNAPLLAGDRFLHIVPASHRRASTPAEIAASSAGNGLSDDQKITQLATDRGVMPGAMEVVLEPGDITYYDANLWHRGWNPAGEPRLTLHAAFWQAHYEVMSHEFGQREALSTQVHLVRLPPVTRTYVQRYLDALPKGEPKRVQDI